MSPDALRTARTFLVIAVLSAAGIGGIASASTAAPTTTVRPTVAFAGTTCVKLDANSWKVTMKWTASNGRYTDFDDYAGTRARVTTIQTRVWVKTVKVTGFGSAGIPMTAPTTVYGRYSHRIAPYLWNGYQNSVTTLNGAYITAAVACPR